MTRVISVRPAHDGWTLTCSAAHGSLFFAQAREAEDAAREIGEGLASEGQPTEVHVHLRGGTMAARFVCIPYSRPPVYWTPAPHQPCDRVGVAA